jgi:hypothetical protein
MKELNASTAQRGHAHIDAMERARLCSARSGDCARGCVCSNSRRAALLTRMVYRKLRTGGRASLMGREPGDDHGVVMTMGSWGEGVLAARGVRRLSNPCEGSEERRQRRREEKARAEGVWRLIHTHSSRSKMKAMATELRTISCVSVAAAKLPAAPRLAYMGRSIARTQ